jgi:hypothetical protein
MAVLSTDLLQARKEVASLQGRLEEQAAAAARAEARQTAFMQADAEAAAAAIAAEKAESLRREAEITRWEPNGILMVVATTKILVVSA